MLVLFLFLGLKLHSNYDLRTQEAKGGIQETIQTENQLKSKITQMTQKKKEGGRYKCDTIKFSYPKEMNLRESKQFLLETDTDYEAFLKCENAKYNPNQNNVEIDGTIMNSGGKHILDRNPDALIVIKNADFKCSSSAFRASTSSNSDAQIIHFMGEGVHTISNTDFKLLGKNPYQYFKDNNDRLLEEFDPTLIVFDDSSMNSISGGQFSNPENKIPARCIRTKKTCTLIVSGTHFYNATALHKGSFFLLDSTGEASILYSHFESGYDEDNCAHAICANQGKVNIANCNFNKVLMNPSSKGSIILAETKTFDFEENSIKFNNPTINCRFLYLSNPGTYNIIQNEFQSFEINQEGSAIYIEKPSEILFDNNKFENIAGSPKKHVLNLNYRILGDRPFVGNKFKNIRSADGFIYIKAEDIEDNITFNSWEFNNVGPNGGGIINVENPNNRSYKLIFNNCGFENNNNVNGGALLINNDAFPSCKGVDLSDCQGHRNTATGRGSVAAIYIDGDINVFDGDFNLNTANEGAVFYIEPPSKASGTCTFSRVTFNRNRGKESHCIWVNVPSSYDDDYTLILQQCKFNNNNDENNYAGGTNCLSNCKVTEVSDCNFLADEEPFNTCGGINITAQGKLDVTGCTFTNCSAGSIEGSYGGGIGYSYVKTDNAGDTKRNEEISISDCTFDNGRGTNGVALLLNVRSLNVDVSDVQILNHQLSNYIFCVFFNTEADNERFILRNSKFQGNSYNSKLHDGDCGGAGIWIAEARPQDYLQSLTAVFDNCQFIDNHSPVSGGAFAYDTSERLKAVDLEFIGCTFNDNSCENSGGACHFATKKTVNLTGCHFNNNNAQSNHLVTGGGALEFTSSVELAIIVKCDFTNCISSKGSFIYTNGPVRGFDVRECTFQELEGNEHTSSVHLDVDSSARTFVFEHNDFKNLGCTGEFGGSGLHIGTGRDCEVNLCTFEGNKGDGQIIVPQSSSRKLIFNRCAFRKGDEGVRALYVQGEAPVEFDTCTFNLFVEEDRNKGRGILVYSVAEAEAFFNNCTFNNVTSMSALDYENSVKVEISWCNFTGVEACFSNVGGLLFITKAREFSLTDCKFDTCGSIHGINNSCINLCPTIESAYVGNCSFRNCGRCSDGGAIYVQNVGDIQLFNSTFQENLAQGVAGNTLSVYVDKGTTRCEISHCQIHTRRAAPKQKIFQFRVFAQQVILTNSVFDKLNADQISESDGGFGGIYFGNVQNLAISHNLFSTRNIAVKIEKCKDINVINNTWQQCYGTQGTGTRAFYIQTTLDTLTFRNNTIKDNPNNNDNAIMTFSAKEIIIEDCLFEDNRYKSEVGGGIGMLFDCKDFTVTFRDCTFTQNKGNVGGALQFGGKQSEQNANKGKLMIYNCHFLENTATGTGGALSFTTEKENVLQGCTFEDNTANRNAGAISIISSQSYEYVYASESNSRNLITNCHFIENSCLRDVHSVYVMNRGRTIFEECTFTNLIKGGSSKSQVMTQRSDQWPETDGFVEFTNTSFEATTDCRGIEVREFGYSTITKCTFKITGFASNGNAICLTRSGRYNDIYDNTFDNCGGIQNNYVVYCSGRAINFYENRINFDNPEASCGCIAINCNTGQSYNHRIHDNVFHDIKLSSSSTGTLYYNCVGGGSSTLLIENNIFENNKGKFCAFNVAANLAISITMINNTIQNNNPGDLLYLCGFDFKGTYKSANTFTMKDNKFIGNTCSAPFGGGIGLWIQNKQNANDYSVNNVFQFKFENCLFKQNRAVFISTKNSSDTAQGMNGKGGAVQIGYSASSCIASPIFKGCQFVENKADNGGGALSLSVIGKVEINGCTFNGNRASVSPDEDPSPFGGAICFLPDDILGDYSKRSDEYKILGSTFTNNIDVTSNRATVIYAASDATPIKIEGNCQFNNNGNNGNSIVANAKNFIIQDSIFSNSNPSSSRSMQILGNAEIKRVTFSNVNFRDQNNHPGIAIYLVDGSSANIDDCIFTDCGANNGADLYAIYADNTNTNITGSIFNFTDSNRAAGSIRIRRSGRFNIKDNKFIMTGGKNKQPSILYNGELRGQSEEYVNIEGNTFDRFKASAEAAVLKGVTNNVYFHYNTIKNVRNAKYILEVYLAGLQSYTFAHNTFLNLTSSAKFGGGAGLWIQNSNNGLYDLIIEYCTFEDSIALYDAAEKENGYGGGLQFGRTASMSNINLEINHCNFIGNQAQRNGGGLSLGIQRSYIISNCLFENNVGGTQDNSFNGGALYIDPVTNGLSPDLITISGCTFRNNTAPAANAIYATDMPNTDISIQDNTVFEDNCKKNKQSNVAAVIIDSRLLSIDSCTFRYTNIASSSRALETFSITTKVSNSLFEQCENEIAYLPNAIWVKEKVISCHIENSSFADCGKSRGDVIRTETRDFLFESSTISFSDYNRATRGMYIPYPSKFNVINSTFIKCRFDGRVNNTNVPQSSAAIEYHGDGARKAGYTEDITIEESTFDSNYGSHTSNILLHRINTYPTLINSTFKRSTRGNFQLVIFFDFLPQEEFRIESFIFENNDFTKSGDGGGSGLWIAQYNVKQTTRDTWPLLFDKCTFRSNHAKYSGGAVAYGQSDSLTFISLTFNECHFIENTCDGTGSNPGGGALWFNSQEIVNISNCYFTGNQASKTSTRAAGELGYGHAIYAAPRSYINVENCRFVDNGADGLESVIQMSGQQFNLTNSEISYTESGKSCRGVYIDFPGIVNIINTKFINCGKNNNVPAEGGGILYKDANSDSVLEEQITIQGCTFDNCRAANGCAMLLHASVPPTLNGNRIVNQQSGKYVISIFYTVFQDYSIVENMNFIGSRGGANIEDGGATGIWIANNKEISNGRPSELIFRNCRWEDNYSPNKGGALHYGNSQTLVGTELTFEDCRFINNRAVEAGGAVSIATISPSVFRNCEFNGNIVDKKSSTSTTKGSAIYVNSETPLCMISGCTFTNSSADEGNAIYATTKVLALHVTDNTRIRNCGSSGSCVVVEAHEFFFLNSQITFDNVNKASRGILIKTRTVIKISDSKFTKCTFCTAFPSDANRQGQGGAILIQRNKEETDTQEDVQLLYSTFDACKSDNGCAIMFWIETNPVIRGNTITNHNYNKYIFTIIRGTNFADLFTIENCSFVKNKFSNKEKQDGGGAAIWVANQQFFNEGELSQLLFKDCNWTKNTGVYGGAFSYGKSNTVKFIQLEFQNCHFENNQASGDQGGALHLTTAVPVTITGCTFYNNKCVNNIQNFGGDQALGGAIYFDTNATVVNILNTTFRKNSAQNGNAIFVSPKTPLVEMQDTHFLSNSNGNVGAQVAHQGVQFRATNCNFDYQVVTLHSKGVDILSKSITDFVNCNFTLCETPYDKGGALFVQDQINSPNIERFTLYGCIFDNCNSSEGAAIYASLSTEPTIQLCTIKNNVQGCSIFIFTFTSKEDVYQVIINNCTFQDNEYLNTEEKPDCGGSGIYITNVAKIEFNKCYFINNKADYVGGALAYGRDNELSDISLQFTSCFFEENKCNGKYGGALYLVSAQETLITDCTFRGNKPLASNQIKGGDIYVDSRSGVNIFECKFESSTTLVEEGNAIYCSSNTDHLSIAGSRFNNCGVSGTVVTSYAKENHISGTDVEFTEAANEKSARGLALYIIPESIVEIQHCKFINCYFNTQNSNLGGGGVYIKATGEVITTDDNFKLNDVQFIGTVANLGAALYLDIYTQISLTSIHVSNCVSNNNILYVKYSNQAECTTLKGCSFVNNKLTSSTDGGGAGILIPQTRKISYSGCSFINNSATGNGGAFAYYNSQESKNTELEFNGCTFNGNNARSNGGALYLVTNQPISITQCIFDSNIANGDSGALYIDCKANIQLKLNNIARNKASSKNAALYVNNAQTLELVNNTISDNICPSSPASVEINNEGTANIKDNKFDYNRQSNSQYQISITGSSSSAVCNFDMNCFTHKGDTSNNNLVHVLSSHAGQLNVPAGNCFDSGQYNSLQHNGGPSSVGDNIFDCTKCGEIYVPTAAPEATPTATRQMTSKPTDIPVPTEKPYIPTSPPTSDSGSTSASTSANANIPGDDSNKGKKKKVNIGMIAGIVAAVVVVIVVVIILLWLFVFRKRRSNNSPQGTMNSNMPGTEENVSGVSGVNTTPQDDPIWAGATATHDNPLFNGSEDQDDDQMMQPGFEESWGENVI